MAIYFSSELESFRLTEKMKLKKWISTVIKNEGFQVGDISYVFCDDAYLLNVNVSYLNHDTYTDIITFDYVEDNVVSGDILISVERVAENAQFFGVDFEHEFRRVMIHGILHLLGNEDGTEEESHNMRAKEDQALELWLSL